MKVWKVVVGFWLLVMMGYSLIVGWNVVKMSGEEKKYRMKVEFVENEMININAKLDSLISENGLARKAATEVYGGVAHLCEILGDMMKLNKKMDDYKLQSLN